MDCETVPEHWVASGPGSPWLVFKLPVQPTHGGQTVRFEALALLPEDVEWRIESLLYHEWVEFLKSFGSQLDDVTHR